MWKTSARVASAGAWKAMLYEEDKQWNLPGGNVRALMYWPMLRSGYSGTQVFLLAFLAFSVYALSHATNIHLAK